MSVLIACDSFKGTLTAPEACAAIRDGLLGAGFENTVLCPLADGGEGTAEAFCAATGARLIRHRVQTMFGQEEESFYGLSADGRVGIVETAATAGLADLSPEQRDVLRASSFGVGAQIRLLLERGCEKIIVGFGGSATNDGGIGALQALGVRFYRSNGTLIENGGGGLAMTLARSADASEAVKIGKTKIVFACDVTNPYFGPEGATRVFGPQKGATPPRVARLDAGMRRFSSVLSSVFGEDVTDFAGAGAAGGLCGGLMGLLHAEVTSGFTVLSEAVNLPQKLRDCDVCVTGEGKSDAQTLFGKLPMRVLEEGKRLSRPVHLLSGCTEEAQRLLQAGFASVSATDTEGLTWPEIRKNAAENLRIAAQKLGERIKKNGIV